MRRHLNTRIYIYKNNDPTFPDGIQVLLRLGPPLRAALLAQGGRVRERGQAKQGQQIMGPSLKKKTQKKSLLPYISTHKKIVNNEKLIMNRFTTLAIVPPRLYEYLFTVQPKKGRKEKYSLYITVTIPISELSVSLWCKNIVCLFQVDEM